MISIIVPVYNVAPYLRQCLDSLIGQTYRDLEIICVNDGSVDESPAILAEYAERDERIKIINQPNQGLSEARNTGIQQIQGEWTMFVDSDDWIDPNTCASVLQAVSAQTDLCIFSYIREFGHVSLEKYVLGNEKKNYSTPSQIKDLFKRLLAPIENGCLIPDKLDSLSTAWGKLYKSEIIKKQQLEFVSTRKIGTEDLLFNVFYFSYIKEAVYLPNTWYHYRKNNAISLTKLYKPDLTKQWMYLFELIDAQIRHLNDSDLQTAMLYRRALCLTGLGLNIVFSAKPGVQQRALIREILQTVQYKEAIRILPYQNLAFHWRIFYGAARFGAVFQVWGMLSVMKKMINR